MSRMSELHAQMGDGNDLYRVNDFMALSPDERDYVSELAYHNHQAVQHAIDAYVPPRFYRARNWIADRLRDWADQISTCPF